MFIRTPVITMDLHNYSVYFIVDPTKNRRKFLNLLRLLKEENSHWHTLGTYLNVDTGVLDDIQRKPREMTVRDKFKNVLTLWMKNKENATWEFLKAALKDLGENRLAGSLNYTGHGK